MDKGIIYLKQNIFEAKKYTYFGVEEINSLRNEIEKLAEIHLFSIESYRKAIKKKIGLKNKIPIYFSDNLMLFYLKEKEDRYYINFKKIYKICFEEKVIIIFKNGDILELVLNKKIISKELSKVETILNYLNNLL